MIKIILIIKTSAIWTIALFPEMLLRARKLLDFASLLLNSSDHFLRFITKCLYPKFLFFFFKEEMLMFVYISKTGKCTVINETVLFKT